MNDSPAARQVNEDTFYVTVSIIVLIALLQTIEAAQMRHFILDLIGVWFFALLMTGIGVRSWLLNRRHAPLAAPIRADQQASLQKGAWIAVSFGIVTSLIIGWGVIEIVRGLDSPAVHWGLKVFGVNLLVACASVQAWWWMTVAAYVGEMRRARQLVRARKGQQP